MYNPSKQTWLNPNIEYLFDVKIYEYDMVHAGLSIIKEYKLLSPKKIEELDRMNKDQAHIAVGLLQRDNQEFSRTLTEKFAEIRQRFIHENDLNDNDIISVKKDAFFVTKICDVTKFCEVEFIIKNRYTSYIRFTHNFNIECYYNDSGIDIKGLSSISENKHRLYTIEFLRKYFRMMENRDKSIRRMIMDFARQFKYQQLEDPYYLEFNSRSHSMNPIYNWYHLVIPLVQIVLGENI